MATHTRWLNADEQAAWIPFVPVLLLLPSALDGQLQADSSVTLYEYVVLSALSEIGEDGLRMSDLAAVTSGAPSRLSQVVGRMEARRWVERRPDPSDGRAALVHLLEEGRTVLSAAAPGHVEAVRRLIFDRLSPAQVKQLRKIAVAVASALLPADSLLSTQATFAPALKRRAPRRPAK